MSQRTKFWIYLDEVSAVYALELARTGEVHEARGLATAAFVDRGLKLLKHVPVGGLILPLWPVRFGKPGGRVEGSAKHHMDLHLDSAKGESFSFSKDGGLHMVGAQKGHLMGRLDAVRKYERAGWKSRARILSAAFRLGVLDRYMPSMPDRVLVPTLDLWSSIEQPGPAVTWMAWPEGAVWGEKDGVEKMAIYCAWQQRKRVDPGATFEGCLVTDPERFGY